MSPCQNAALSYFKHEQRPAITIALIGLGLFCLWFPVLTDAPLERSHFTLPLGHGLHLSFQGFGLSMGAGGLTLAIFILPSTIASWETAFQSVPLGLRQASLALGATRWRTLWSVVLPQAMPELLATTRWGILRAAGATVPIMWTSAVALKIRSSGAFFSQPVPALPYHIYAVTTRVPPSESAGPMLYGSVTACVLLSFSLAGLAIVLKGTAKRRSDRQL